uniref:Uncharacterized protein n=1 Tax=Ditylenchus dipsaci TaxID=166011 RepID=A0A915D146_9BILA
MPVPVKRPLTFYNDENKVRKPNLFICQKAKDQREGSEMSEGDVSNGEQLSESESETRSSTASEASNQGTQPAISINPIAHSTPIIPVQQGHDAGNYWGSGSTATQFQMASYLGYTSHNYLNPNFTNNYYANNPLVNNQQQMMANFSSQSLSNLNPNHLPIAPVNQHPPFTANNFLPSDNNSAHYNPTLSNELNFSKLASSFELSATLDSGLGRVVHGGQHSGSSGSSASTSSRTDESYSNEPAEHKNILTPYHEQQPNPHQVYQANYPLIVPDLPLCEVPAD